MSAAARGRGEGPDADLGEQLAVTRDGWMGTATAAGAAVVEETGRPTARCTPSCSAGATSSWSIAMYSAKVPIRRSRGRA
jgi:hypothetical protein